MLCPEPQAVHAEARGTLSPFATTTTTNSKDTLYSRCVMMMGSKSFLVHLKQMLTTSEMRRVRDFRCGGSEIIEPVRSDPGVSFGLLGLKLIRAPDRSFKT